VPSDPPDPGVIEMAVYDALAIVNKTIGTTRPDEGRQTPDHTAMRAACFAEVLRARLAYEYGLGLQPGYGAT
jgi:hypothetical protein